jgi:hypothetical protein
MSSVFYSPHRRDFIKLEVVDKLKVELTNNKFHYIIRGLDKEDNKKLSSFVAKDEWEFFDVDVKFF